MIHPGSNHLQLSIQSHSYSENILSFLAESLIHKENGVKYFIWKDRNEGEGVCPSILGAPAPKELEQVLNRVREPSVSKTKNFILLMCVFFMFVH